MNPRTRAVTIIRIAATLERELALTSPITQFAFRWARGSESGLPLPTRLALTQADGEIHVYDETGPGTDEAGQPLNDLAFLQALSVHDDILELLEADFAPPEPQGVLGYTVGAVGADCGLDAVLKATDWALLARQKAALVDLRGHLALADAQRDMINGIIHLVDAWMDGAAADGWPVKAPGDA
ncbi:hypothetical protein [Deinococcus frigens]|uniref:hypothetical protein n=1 Tax=Deinococcus frigens TaxID=249403 RepID=UPI0004958719|nr:hypothetical protein [Deinococcus frigens]